MHSKGEERKNDAIQKVRKGRVTLFKKKREERVNVIQKVREGRAMLFKK